MLGAPTDTESLADPKAEADPEAEVPPVPKLPLLLTGGRGREWILVSGTYV